MDEKGINENIIISNIAKSRLISAISQELKTPMSVISGMIPMLESTALDNTQKGYLDMIKSSNQFLTDLVEDILAVSHIDTAPLMLESHSFNLDQTIKEIWQRKRSEATAKGLELKIDIDEMIPKNLIGDVNRLKIVLYHLIDNAIRYSNHGEISVDIKYHSNQGDQTELLFTIEDRGVGISDDRVKKLFKSYAPVEKSTERGLGLMVSKIIIEEMGGTLSVSSREGEGTTLSFNCVMKRETVSNKSDDTVLDSAVFDRDLLLKKLNNNSELYKKIVQVFFEETSQKIEELQLHVDLKDFEKITSISHSIKGAAGNITASVLQECAKNLEFAGKEGDSTNVKTLFDQLTEEFKKLESKDIL